MASSTRLRRTSAWLATALVAVLAPLAGPAAPAHAAECTSEDAPPPTFPPTIPPDYGCDDVNPPDTKVTGMSPSPNDAGWTKTNDMTFEFAEEVDDADQGPWTFMCKLTGPSQAHDWEACTSPKTYTDLADSEASDYTFAVYAVDTDDSATPYTGDPFTTADDEDPAKPDDDSASPSTRTWKQDTQAPNTFVFEGPYDVEGTGWPIAKQPRVSFLLEASQEQAPVTYRCNLTGVSVPCGEGRVTLTDLSGGDHVFGASTTDVAGNEDKSPATKKFVVPHNLTQGRNWTRQKGKGYFARDVMQTKRYGATIKFQARNIQEFRLIAPRGPDLGKIQIRLGDWRWQTYDLGGKATRSRYIVVRGPNKPLFSGRILIRSISRGKPVQVDALVFPPK